MIKKSITYQDIDGNEKTEDFCFQITKAQFVKKALKEGGSEYIKKLEMLSKLTPDQMQGRGRDVMDTFETLLGDAVGKRVADTEGDLLIKNERIKNRFMYSGAYDALFMELVESPDSGAIFLRNIMPRDAQSEIEKELAKRAAEGQPTPFPQSLENAVQANSTPELQAAPPVLEEADKDERPAWLKEMREPTSKELLQMPKDEMSLAFKMREEGKLNVANKNV